MKSRTGVFKHLNISKVISMLNFLHIVVLLVDHCTVSLLNVLSCKCKAACKPQGIILLALREVQGRQKYPLNMEWFFTSAEIHG